MIQSIVPPYLLARIAQAGESAMPRAAAAAERALVSDIPLRDAREARSASPHTAPIRAVPSSPTAGTPHNLTRAPQPHRTVFDAKNSEDLPGTQVRVEGGPAPADAAANEAYDALGATFALYQEAFGRNSIDDKGLPLLATVHYGHDYDNAYWNGERMVFGDGEGEVFGRFTASVSVIGHELTHGVTQFTAGLAYEGQSGALNESFSDVMGALVEQHLKKQTAADASWLIGEGLFTAAVKGRALRSMLAPGTAYDDPVLGRDPQPADMAHYVETSDDNGGVHLNSGIPNRAFAIASTTLGGFAWLSAGQVWFDTITGPLSPTADFAEFAAATVTASTKRFGADSTETSAVSAAWAKVGVLRGDSAH
ncbi:MULTISPECIES: M4 family metallopeptidase [Subtercola]|uniref:Neutral metalloproteinase n=1 Tax=Subtercola vilae TaxID=2056433 RepID=A0A4T2BLZ1_9MICO|nr:MULTISPECIES: M4 family metallopeptidase [Subtercola]MEA9986572.1 M4 family metallopeptidase [Subtercola sp. RTI3]TIH32070.1 M4 family peptidase [Subtercola vilae]